MSISPPRPKGPPLNTLRAFEAAARLGGFTAAAEELFVTPGAVAQHIKALEAWVGEPLFERHSKGVSLSPLGLKTNAAFTSAFDQLGEAVLNLRSKSMSKHIHIATLPSIAQLWLSPRLPAVRAVLPKSEISVTALETHPNLQREIFDLSLFFEASPPNSHSVALEPDVLFPVCTPDLATRLNTLNDLSNHTLLRDAAWPDDWALWINAAGGETLRDLSGPIYSLYGLALEEAKNGAGVLLGHQALVDGALASGDLVAPFEFRLTSNRHLYATPSQSISQNATLRAFINALLRP